MEDLLSYLNYIPDSPLQECVLELILKSEDPWEAPFANNNTKLRFESLKDLRTYIQYMTTSQTRILSLNIVYSDKTWVYFDVLLSKLKLGYSFDKFQFPKLLSSGLVGNGKFIEDIQILF